MFDEVSMLKEQFDDALFGNLNFDFVLNMVGANPQEFISQVIEQDEPIHNNLIKDLITWK
jgi:hypothetical protein